MFTGSHPSRVCGLKPDVPYKGFDPSHVTPFAGVWIETSQEEKTAKTTAVTPFTGA